MQTSALRHQLNQLQAYEYEFIDGGESAPPAPGLEAFLAPDEALAYYNQNSAPSILAAVDDLTEYIAQYGPFEGVMGFSQGASLAAMVLARARHANPPPFSFAVFICAGLPYCDKTLVDEGRMKFVSAKEQEQDSTMIHVPTAHIFGSKDPDVAYSKGLVDLCQPWGRVVMDHGAGHEIPRVPVDITLEMARVVEQVMTKATLGQ